MPRRRRDGHERKRVMFVLAEAANDEIQALARELNISNSEVIEQLWVRRAVDPETGLPTWAEEVRYTDGQDQLALPA